MIIIFIITRTITITITIIAASYPSKNRFGITSSGSLTGASGEVNAWPCKMMRNDALFYYTHDKMMMMMMMMMMIVINMMMMMMMCDDNYLDHGDTMINMMIST